MNIIRPLPAIAASLIVVAGLAACRPAPTTEPSNPQTSRAASPAAPAGPARSQVRTRSSHWQCGDLRVTTRFDARDLESMTVLFSGRRLSLRAADARDGVRFTDDAGNEFWSRPGAVHFTRAGKAALACSKTRQPSPWADAESRGMAWRAAGNEPGWFAEVASGPGASLAATLDYGDRRIRVARTETLTSDTGFHGIASDGTPVRLLIGRKPCVDGMSDEEFEATATLQVGEQRYDGCAASLAD